LEGALGVRTESDSEQCTFARRIGKLYQKHRVVANHPFGARQRCRISIQQLTRTRRGLGKHRARPPGREAGERTQHEADDTGFLEGAQGKSSAPRARQQRGRQEDFRRLPMVRVEEDRFLPGSTLTAQTALYFQVRRRAECRSAVSIWSSGPMDAEAAAIDHTTLAFAADGRGQGTQGCLA
jgi:hypothetical protein